MTRLLGAVGVSFAAAAWAGPSAQVLAPYQGDWLCPGTAVYAPIHAVVVNDMVTFEQNGKRGDEKYSFVCTDAGSRGALMCRGEKGSMKLWIEGDRMMNSLFANWAFVRKPDNVESPLTGGAKGKPAAPEAPATVDELVWKAESSDGSVVVTQAPGAKGACMLEAKKADKRLWSSTTCAGKRLDFKFISPSGDRLAVIYPLPVIEGSVRTTPVMRMFKKGKQQYASPAASTAANWEKLKTGGSNFYWLAGALDASGDAPKYSGDGAAFDFATVDGKKYHIDLDEH